MWLEHKNFKDSFSNWWMNNCIEGWEWYKFMSKLKSIKEHLKIWNLNVFGDMRMERKGPLGRLEALDRLKNSIAWSQKLREEMYSIKNKL